MTTTRHAALPTGWRERFDRLSTRRIVTLGAAVGLIWGPTVGYFFGDTLRTDLFPPAAVIAVPTFPPTTVTPAPSSASVPPTLSVAGERAEDADVAPPAPRPEKVAPAVVRQPAAVSTPTTTEEAASATPTPTERAPSRVPSPPVGTAAPPTEGRDPTGEAPSTAPGSGEPQPATSTDPGVAEPSTTDGPSEVQLPGMADEPDGRGSADPTTGAPGSGPPSEPAPDPPGDPGGSP